MTISKSKFVAGVQCLKRLYWQVHEPELAAQPDASAQAIMEQGHDVGLLARHLFPGGVEVSGDGGIEHTHPTLHPVATAPIPSPASSTTAAILHALMITSAICR
jgi:hypothetical protein